METTELNKLEAELRELRAKCAEKYAVVKELRIIAKDEIKRKKRESDGKLKMELTVFSGLQQAGFKRAAIIERMGLTQSRHITLLRVTDEIWRRFDRMSESRALGFADKDELKGD